MWNIEFSCKGNKDPSTGIHRKHLYIAHAQKPLIKADVGEARKPCRSKSINHLCENMLIPYESISMHMHAHGALTLFYKRLFFLALFFKFYLFQKQISDKRYTICLNPIKHPVVVPDLGSFWLGEKSPDDTNHLTQPHSMGSNTACWFIGKYGLSNAISEDPNEVTEFCGVS